MNFKHNPNVKFSIKQLDQIGYIVNCYFGGRLGDYIHSQQDFEDWLTHQRDNIYLSNADACSWDKQKMKEIFEKEEIVSLYEPCKVCFGDPNNTPGGCRCKKCGIVGNMPWGG